MATADPQAGGSPVQTGYAPVNGLSMYYEIYGEVGRWSCCMAPQ
jgi:hypothetical protein